MINNEQYKIYQLMEFFVEKYSYTNLYVKGVIKQDEVLLFNKDNTSYQLIKISNKPLFYASNDYEILENFIDTYKKKFSVKEINLLDIHISNEEISGDEAFDTCCINVDYINGIDIEEIYPGINGIIHDVENQENEINSRISSINSSIKKQIENAKKRPFFEKLKSNPARITIAIIALCCIMQVFVTLLSSKYSQSAVLVFLGADYKTFTLGLHEYWRLFTTAFLHGSFFHLFCNMLSLFFMGTILEPLLGKGKYILLLVCGIIIGSLTSGALTGNLLSVGLSSGIYCLFAYFIMYFVNNNMMILTSIMPTIFVNIAINFMSNVSWQAHLGGAICGILFYYIYQNDKIDFKILPVIFLLIIGLFVKFNTSQIKPFYGATDLEVVKISEDYGLDSYARETEIKLLELYYK